MAGRIILEDGVVTSRIILRCKLSAACYEVLPADGAHAIRRLMRLDGIVGAVIDAGPHAAGIAARLAEAGLVSRPARVPLILLVDSGDPALRMACFDAGADAVLERPVDETLLLATLRRLLRSAAGDAELLHRAGITGEAGFAEMAEGFAPPAELCMVPLSAGLSLALPPGRPPVARLSRRPSAEVLAMDTAPDVLTLIARPEDAAIALRLIPELKSRAATRDSAILLAIDTAAPGKWTGRSLGGEAAQVAAMALDLGADDVVLGTRRPAETALRLSRLLARKAAADTLRRRVSTGLRLAARDPLTGLYNRRVAMPRLEEMLAEGAVDGQPLAVMLIDLDRFKRVNDTYGHGAGDRVLTEVAARLAATAGPRDLVARIGGEEFLVVLPGHCLGAAASAAGRFSAALRDLPVTDTAAPGGIPMTASIGLAVRDNRRPVTAAALIEEADTALRAAKSDGRDQITVARTAA